MTNDTRKATGLSKQEAANRRAARQRLLTALPLAVQVLETGDIVNVVRIYWQSRDNQGRAREDYWVATTVEGGEYELSDLRPLETVQVQDWKKAKFHLASRVKSVAEVVAETERYVRFVEKQYLRE